MNIRKLFKPILASLLILVIFITTLCYNRTLPTGLSHFLNLTGLTFISDSKVSSGENTYTHPDAASTDNTAFTDFTNSMFKELVSSDALTLHTYLNNPEAFGITGYNTGFSRYTLSNCDNFRSLTDTLNSIKSFDRNTLSPRQQITYDQLVMYFTNELEHSDLYIFDSCLSTTIGLQVQLPLILAQYQLNDEADISAYFDILKDTDDFFSNIVEYEKLRYKKGYFFSESVLKKIISQCDELYKTIDTGFLSSTFKSRLDSLNLPAEKTDSYIRKNSELLRIHVKKAYKILADGLRSVSSSASSPITDASLGLSCFPNGKTYYTYLLKQSLGWSKSVDEYNAYLDKYLSLSLKSIEKTYSTCNITDDDLKNFTFTLTEPDEILKDLKEKITNDFPPCADIEYSLDYVDETLENYVSPAMYFTPQLDNIQNNSIYINRAQTAASDMYPTLAHEAFPGHMYQITYFADSAPDLIRFLIAPAGYTEGWATYCEALSYSYAPSSNSSINELLCANYIAMLCLYGKIDIGVNYYGWSCENVHDFLVQYGFDSAPVDEIYDSMVCEPSNYCRYILGYIGFCELKESYKQKNGESFNLKSFHQYILDIGPAPFDLLFSNMDHNTVLRHKTD